MHLARINKSNNYNNMDILADAECNSDSGRFNAGRQSNFKDSNMDDSNDDSNWEQSSSTDYSLDNMG